MSGVSGLPQGVVRGLSPLAESDIALIRSVQRYTGPGTEGYVTDFLGMKTRTSFFDHMDEHDGLVLDYPIPGDPHYSGLEWAGMLRAVRDAVAEIVVLELGAGWGPWLVAAALASKRKGIKRCRLLGVEGAQAHYQYMLTHFRDNGLNPDGHTLLHGVVAPADGVAEFPVLENPRGEWGAVALRGSDQPAARTERLRAYSLPTLIAPFETVDLIHVDIQGHEAEVIVASRAALQEKVRRLVVGTHSRTIEQQLFDELGTAGWELEAEEPTIVRQANGAIVLFIDGCQVWRNARFA